MPEDLIPYWDFDAPDIPNEPRDASAAAVYASALLELSTFSSNKNEYFTAAETILKNLSSEKYLAKTGGNGFFILKHSTGNWPKNSEIDTPLSYADYYFVEALLRSRRFRKDVLVLGLCCVVRVSRSVLTFGIYDFKSLKVPLKRDVRFATI